MKITLNIGNHKPRSFYRRPNPVKISLDVDNPHMLIVGSSGSGKSVMCKHITLANPATRFVYVGRDERANYSDNEGLNRSPDPTDGERERLLLSILETAGSQAKNTESVLILEEANLYLAANRAEFFKIIGDLTESGVHIIFTSQTGFDAGTAQRLCLGTIALLCTDKGTGLAPYLVSIARAVGVNPTRTKLSSDSPMVQVYPELVAHDYPMQSRGDFILRIPGGMVFDRLTVPSP